MMEFLANRNDLCPILKNMTAVVSRSFASAAEDCILMEADAQSHTVIFTAVGRDCSLQIRHNTGVSVAKSGRAMLFAGVLEQAVRLFSDEATHIVADERNVILRNKTAEYMFPRMDDSNFPKPDHSAPDALFDCADLPQVVAQTLFSASVADDAAAVQCIHMVLQDSMFRAETYDGYRLTMLEREGSPQGVFDMLIPGNSMRLLSSILKDKDACKIGIAHGIALFLRPNMIFAAKTEQTARFADLQKIMGGLTVVGSARVDANLFIAALKQIGVGNVKDARVILRTEAGGIALRLWVEDKHNPQSIQAETAVAANVESPIPVSGFCYGYRFLREALQSMRAEALHLQWDNTGALAIHAENRVHLLLPMRMPSGLAQPKKQTKTKKKKSAA